MARNAVHLRLCWHEAQPPTVVLPAVIRIRALQASDQLGLGNLIWHAFRGTVDDEYASVAEAEEEADQTLADKWGPVVCQASLCAGSPSGVLGAVVVVRDTRHENLPLLAFAVTDPTHQRRGIGQRLIEESINRLDASGLNELHLAVVPDNPAFRLYQRLGFEVVSDDQGG